MRGLAILLLVLAGGVALAHVWLQRSLPAAPAAPAVPAAPAWPSLTPPPAEAWQVIVPASSSGITSTDPVAGRYRLAGTFFLFGAGDGDNADRRAIVDDLQNDTQEIVREGSAVGEFTVARVLTDRILLRAGTVEVELPLSFKPGAAVAASPAQASSVAMEDMPALESSRFGKRVGENRWVLQREALLQYYRDVLEDPERIAALYMSMKPDYKEEKIEGYRVGLEGEADFFAGMGLQEGDTIRRVNSMRMVSQRRAEYFLSEFLKDRVSALVLDVERDGKAEKKIYLIR